MWAYHWDSVLCFQFSGLNKPLHSPHKNIFSHRYIVGDKGRRENKSNRERVKKKGCARMSSRTQKVVQQVHVQGACLSTSPDTLTLKTFFSW